MKAYVHARLSRAERTALDDLKAATGRSESDLVRLGIRLSIEHLKITSAADLAGDSIGRFVGGPSDLATNRDHLHDFGR